MNPPTARPGVHLRLPVSLPVELNALPVDDLSDGATTAALGEVETLGL
jgi:hypothetical protein